MNRVRHSWDDSLPSGPWTLEVDDTASAPPLEPPTPMAQYVSTLCDLRVQYLFLARTHDRPTCLPSPLPLVAESQASRPISAYQLGGRSSGFSSNSVRLAERANALLAKHGFEAPASDWPMPSGQPVQRVERRIRMRVRFWCHLCNTQYGNGTACVQCTHTRCRQCIRYPPKRVTPRFRLAARNDEVAENLTTLPVPVPSGIELIPAELPSLDMVPSLHVAATEHLPGTEVPISVPETPVLEYRSTHRDTNPLGTRVSQGRRARVGQICHACRTAFDHGKNVCSRCGHERCRDCPTNQRRRRLHAILPETLRRDLEGTEPQPDLEADDLDPELGTPDPKHPCPSDRTSPSATTGDTSRTNAGRFPT